MGHFYWAHPAPLNPTVSDNKKFHVTRLSEKKKKKQNEENNHNIEQKLNQIVVICSMKCWFV